jgi:hypothetical protein
MKVAEQECRTRNVYTSVVFPDQIYRDVAWSGNHSAARSSMNSIVCSEIE